MADYELGKRVYTKIDGRKFKIEENRHLESEIEYSQQAQLMANALLSMKKCIETANKAQEDFVKYATWYDEWCDIMNEAKAEGELDYADFVKVNVPDCFDIIEAKAENLPKINLGE